MGSGEAGGGVNVADLDGGAQGAGGVGDAGADGTVADDEDRSAVQGEAGDVEEGVGCHEADEVAVVEPLFDGDGVPVEDRVGEAQVPDAVYACIRGSKPPRTLSISRSPPSGGRRAARR